mmetsp:Transcript_4921/g.9214  ORF Transcript_4921/g.9214 Transcript_4921/m.9214 type:complete len:188 (+) Transcript_4921:30-593(+)
MTQARARKIQHFASDIFSGQQQNYTRLRRYSSSTDLSEILLRSNSFDSLSSPSKRLSRARSNSFINLCFHPEPTADENCGAAANLNDSSLVADGGFAEGAKAGKVSGNCKVTYDRRPRVKPFHIAQMQWYDSRTKVLSRETQSYSPQAQKLSKLQTTWEQQPSTRRSYKRGASPKVFKNDLSRVKGK